MPLLIDSAPDCITHKEHFSADDLADFVLQDNFKDCAGFGTFMPGSTYGDDGTGAETLYMIVTWVGIVVMVVVLAAWVLYENRRLIAAVAGFSPVEGGPAAGPPPQPGGAGQER